MQKETVPQRLWFMALEWTLIIGWLIVLLIVWREALFYVYYVQFTLGRAARAVYVLSMLVLSIGCVGAVALSGYWLKRRPRGQALSRRWLIGIGWIALAFLLGYVVVFINDGSLSILPEFSLNGF